MVSWPNARSIGRCVRGPDPPPPIDVNIAGAKSSWNRVAGSDNAARGNIADETAIAQGVRFSRAFSRCGRISPDARFVRPLPRAKPHHIDSDLALDSLIGALSCDEPVSASPERALAPAWRRFSWPDIVVHCEDALDQVTAPAATFVVMPSCKPSVRARQGTVT